MSLLARLSPLSAHRGLLTAVFAAGLVCLQSGCASAPGSRVATPPTAAQAAGIDDLEERALLLLMTDQLRYESVAVAAGLNGDADLRRETALTLGRVGDAQGVPALESLLGDADARVRRAAAFALGELAEAGAANISSLLRGAVADADRQTGILAIEAMAKGGAALPTVIESLLAAPADELLPRLVPSLFRFRTPGVIAWAEQVLDMSAIDLVATDPAGSDLGVGGGLRAMAAYGISRNAQPEAAPLLRRLLEDQDPWIRGWAARALGQTGIGEREDLARLRLLLDDAQPGPVIQALRAGRRLVDAGLAPPSTDWRPRLLTLMDDLRPGVSVTAIEASAAWLLDDELGSRLSVLAASGSTRQRELALLALAEAGDPRVTVHLRGFVSDPEPVLRAAAAQAAGLAGALEWLETLIADRDPQVRRAALETVLALTPDIAGQEQLAEVALADQDFGVRSSIVDWSVDNPILSVETLVRAFERGERDRSSDVPVAVVRALGARAAGEPTERDTVITILEQLAKNLDPLVRRGSARALAELGRPAPPVGIFESKRTTEIYRQIVAQTRRPVVYELETEDGIAELELACPEAPLHCLSFMQLADQGFFDGLSWHRVVPDFVVQGGDPRGDGLGGPGYSLRDEINLLRFTGGVLGMAHSGSHTAGSQFFVTLSPQPHLDGGYTVFGRVLTGADIWPRLEQGDRLLSVRRRSP